MDLTFGEQIKIILKRKNMTIRQLAELIEIQTGRPMSRQNLTQKLSRDNFQEQDMKEIVQVLGCILRISVIDPMEETISSLQTIMGQDEAPADRMELDTAERDAAVRREIAAHREAVNQKEAELRQREAARQQEAARQRELERQQEAAHQRELERQQEAAHQWELERQQEAARQQETAIRQEMMRQQEELARREEALRREEERLQREEELSQQADPLSWAQKKPRVWPRLIVPGERRKNTQSAEQVVQSIGQDIQSTEQAGEEMSLASYTNDEPEFVETEDDLELIDFTDDEAAQTETLQDLAQSYPDALQAEAQPGQPYEGVIPEAAQFGEAVIPEAAQFGEGVTPENAQSAEGTAMEEAAPGEADPEESISVLDGDGISGVSAPYTLKRPQEEESAAASWRAEESRAEDADAESAAERGEDADEENETEGAHRLFTAPGDFSAVSAPYVLERTEEPPVFEEEELISEGIPGEADPFAAEPEQSEAADKEIEMKFASMEAAIRKRLNEPLIVASEEQPAEEKEPEEQPGQYPIINPATGEEYETNTVRRHPDQPDMLLVYDREEHRWILQAETAFNGFQIRKRNLLGADYEPPIYLD